MNTLTARDLRAGYGGEPVLKDISFSIDLGSRIVILGENGCGKTTLLRCICGLMPYEGSIQLDGEEIGSLSRDKLSRRVAMLSQFSDAYFSYTVRETVMLGRYLHLKGIFGIPGEQDNRIVDRCMEIAGIAELADKNTDELSGGQRQRVFLARALAQDTDIIVLDEPTNHLDLKYTETLTDYLTGWVGHTPAAPAADAPLAESSAATAPAGGASTGNPHTLIAVFHDIALALSMADVCILMAGGSIYRIAPADEVRAHKEWLNAIYGTDVERYYARFLAF